MAAVVDRPRPGRPGREGRRCPARLPRHRDGAGRLRVPRPAAASSSSTSPTPTRWSKALRRRRAGLAGVADEPGARDRGHPDDRRRRPRRGRHRGRRQHLRHPAAPAAARRRRRHRPALRRPSTSPATATSLMGALVTRDDELYARPEGSPRPAGRDPRAVRGLARAARPAHPATCGSSGPRPTPWSWPAGSSSTRRSPRSATRASAASSPSYSPAVPRPPTCSPTPPGSGCTRPRWAAWSRRSSGGAAGRPRPPPSPTRWCGCPSASRTSTTSGPTSRQPSNAADPSD